MKSLPEFFRTEAELEEAISRPSPELVEMMEFLRGDFIFLGVSGKMGISMACMAKRACDSAGIRKRIIGVSRFSDSENKEYLEEQGVETISGDLLDPEFVKSLPNVTNVVYLAGTKFGTQDNQSYTWAMNAYLPGLVVEQFSGSRIVALSTGCVYPLVNIESGGSTEADRPDPLGEYAQSCLGRERLFEYGSVKHGARAVLIRLNYSVEMRYGVLVDIAAKVAEGEPVDVSMGYANVIWQGDANNMILRSFPLCVSPPLVLNVTGPETISVRDVASYFGERFGKTPVIVGREEDSALLSNASLSFEKFGKPMISVEQVMEWIAKWVGSGHRLLGKPTHFEVRDGKY